MEPNDNHGHTHNHDISVQTDRSTELPLIAGTYIDRPKTRVSILPFFILVPTLAHIGLKACVSQRRRLRQNPCSNGRDDVRLPFCWDT